MENKAYIYKILDIKRKKVVYIGQHNGNNKYYSSSSLILTRYKKIYGTKIFRKRFKLEIIEHCELMNLDNKEIYYIKLYDTYKNGLNLTEGGSKNLSRNAIKGKTFPKKNEKLKGRKYSERSIILMKESKIGFKPHESCHKIRIEKMSKTVLQYDLNGNFIKEWFNGKEAAKILGIKSYGEISACCLGKTKTASGFIWKYKKNKIEKKINPFNRKEYKKGVKRIKNQAIEINNKSYNSITQAAIDLGWSFGKLNWWIKNNKIKYKWLKK